MTITDNPLSSRASGLVRFRVAILFALVLCVALTAAPALAQQVGVSAAVRGSVAINTSPASSGQFMFLGDRVQSQAQSGMQVMLLDESVFTIGENNDLTIDRFVYDPDRSTGEIAASASQGFFRFVSGGVGAVAPQNIEINTPSATIGVRGTTVDVIIGQAAIDLAISLGVAAGLEPLDPATAVFVMLRGPSSQFGGITQRGRVQVSTGGGSTELRREGYGVFIPRAGAAPSAAVAVTDPVDDDIIASIELPGVGTSTTVPGVDFTDPPVISVPELPLPGAVDPDLPGSGFIEQIDTMTDPDDPYDPYYPYDPSDPDT
ncbi:MAG: FecR domain-containing protein [Devosiaceae bacterium]|nr:FecR domain-containing protein [Devosiaceae bacterium MH13]